VIHAVDLLLLLIDGLGGVLGGTFRVILTSHEKPGQEGKHD